MTESKQDEEKFLELLIKYHDDSISEHELDTLKTYLSSSANYIAKFNDFSLLTTNLIHCMSETPRVETAGPTKVIKYESYVLLKLIALAAFIALSLYSASIIISLEQQTESHHQAATYSSKINFLNKDVEWEFGEELITEYHETKNGWYKLLKGEIQLTFSSGAVVNIKGPSLFAIVSPMESYLEYGEVSVYAPESARNFTVKVPTMDIVDLGTKFSIHIDPKDGESNVEVTEGLVDVHFKTSKAKESLFAGAIAKVDSRGDLLSLNNPTAPPELFSHWPFDFYEQNFTPDVSLHQFKAHIVGNTDALMTLGKSGQAFNLNDDQYLDLSQYLNVLPKNNFTLATWVKNPTNMIFSMSDGSKNNRLQFERYQNRLLYGWQKESFFDSVSAFVTWEEDKWHHVAFSLSGGRVSLFMDGKKCAHNVSLGRLNTQILGPSDFNVLDRAYIGILKKGTPSENFKDSIQKLKGQIDDVQIYKSALNEEQIRHLYENPGQVLN